MQADSILFDFHGVLVRVTSADGDALRFVQSDFSSFPSQAAGEPAVEIKLYRGDPPWERIPDGAPAVVHTKDAVVYKHEKKLFYDSFGRALVIYDPKKNRAEIHTPDLDLLFEKAYLMIVSRVGELLDRRGIHRIHAMGVVYKGRAVICLLPMGGGKTTLTLSLLEKDDFELLSEEIPLVIRDGTLRPMPIRMGITEGTKTSIPDEFLKPFRRTHYGPKVLIDARYFEDRIATSAVPGILFIGRRIHSSRPAIERISKRKAFRALLSACVMGVGLPQLLEYLLRFDWSDLFRQAPIHWSRLIASLALLRRSDTYLLSLGTDIEANATLVESFIREKYSSRPDGQEGER